MIENTELDKIMTILESLEDEELAVTMLRKFNEKSSNAGKLILNHDQNLDNDLWKKQCDEAQKELNEVVREILDLA